MWDACGTRICSWAELELEDDLVALVQKGTQPDMQGTHYGTSATMRRNAMPYLKHDPGDMRPGLRPLSDPMVPRLNSKSYGKQTFNSTTQILR